MSNLPSVLTPNERRMAAIFTKLAEAESANFARSTIEDERGAVTTYADLVSALVTELRALIVAEAS